MIEQKISDFLKEFENLNIQKRIVFIGNNSESYATKLYDLIHEKNPNQLICIGLKGYQQQAIDYIVDTDKYKIIEW